jgi:hypothetical protein
MVIKGRDRVLGQQVPGAISGEKAAEWSRSGLDDLQVEEPGDLISLDEVYERLTEGGALDPVTGQPRHVGRLRVGGGVSRPVPAALGIATEHLIGQLPALPAGLPGQYGEVSPAE